MSDRLPAACGDRGRTGERRRNFGGILAQVTRRYFLLSSAAWSAGCAVRRSPAEAPTSASQVRQPAVGQSWRYSKQDLFTHGLLIDQVDRVASVGATIAIESSSEAIAEGKGKSHWGADALRKYFPHHDTPVGALPGEIQNPWGKIWVDPHWGQVQVYETAIPLWPEQLRPGWQVQRPALHQRDQFCQLLHHADGLETTGDALVRTRSGALGCPREQGQL